MRATAWSFGQVLSLTALGVLAGCAATDGGEGARVVQNPTACAPGDTLCMAGMMNLQPGAGAGQPVGGMGGGAIGPGGGTAGTGSQTAQPGATGVPCDVAPVLSEGCTLCHGSVPMFTAPMSLMTLADFHAPAPSNPALKVHEVMGARINAQEIGRRMPPASAEALAPSGLTALNAWLNGGAPGGACQIMAGGGGTAGDGGGTTVPSGPGGSGGLSETPIAYDDPNMECYELRAHAPGDKMQPYSVPTTPDYYVNFDFMAPWNGTVYSRSYEVLIDNTDVVHHWLFYRNSGPKTDGGIAQSSGTHPDGQLTHGWAPGGTDSYFHKDVGAELSGTTSYTLELHYNNTTGGAAPDASGIRVCVTPTKPTFVATLSWLGTDNLSGTMASGTCDPSTNERIHIIGATPHMHTKGTRMQVVLTRAAGGSETLHDMPFDFAYQRGYLHDVWIEPGDRIATTCYYNAPANFGEGTTDEMCYWFAMHYPSNGLTNGNPVATFIHGPNTCLN